MSARRSRVASRITLTHKDLRATVNKAIFAHNDRQIEQVASADDAHKLLGRRKRPSRFAPPPVRHEGLVYSTPAERADVFFRTKLCRNPTAPDLPLDSPLSPPSRKIDLPASIEEAEVENCLLRVPSTAAGHDRLAVTTLKYVWTVQAWREWIVTLFRVCLRVGHHPSTFRVAEVVIIPKPNKTDLSSVRNWRPILLLPALGKGLERLIARRLARSALTEGLLSTSQLGALPGRSAVDLVDCLVHDVATCSIWRSLCANIALLTVARRFLCVRVMREATRDRRADTYSRRLAVQSSVQ